MTVVVGDTPHVSAASARAGTTSADRVEVVHASEVVTTLAPPAQAFGAKPDSSMRVALGRVANGPGDAGCRPA